MVSTFSFTNSHKTTDFRCFIQILSTECVSSVLSPCLLHSFFFFFRFLWEHTFHLLELDTSISQQVKRNGPTIEINASMYNLVLGLNKHPLGHLDWIVIILSYEEHYWPYHLLHLHITDSLHVRSRTVQALRRETLMHCWQQAGKHTLAPGMDGVLTPSVTLLRTSFIIFPFTKWNS